MTPHRRNLRPLPRALRDALYPAAACRDYPPHLFDAATWDEAGPALDVCRSCPVPTECEQALDPRRTHYEGVAAGLVWRDGAVVPPP